MLRNKYCYSVTKRIHISFQSNCQEKKAGWWSERWECKISIVAIQNESRKKKKSILLYGARQLFQVNHMRIVVIILIHNDHDNEIIMIKENHYDQLILSISLRENLKLSLP